MSSYLIQEAGGRFLLEDGTGAVLLEVQPIVTGDYLVQEADGTSRFTLEDGTGFVLLESAGPPPPPTPRQPSGGFISMRRRPRQLILRDIGDDDDAALAITLMLRTIRRRST